jgi:hypothetical protein
MATIRKRRDKYEVRRRAGLPHISKTFRVLKCAQAWTRQMAGALRGVTLGLPASRWHLT